MLYVEQSLGPDEELVHVGKFHWMYTFKAFFAIFWGVVASILVIVGSVFIYKKLGFLPPEAGWLSSIKYLHPGLRIMAFIVFILGLLSFAQLMIIKATTEIAITNSRLVYKRGLIARNVGEISIDRIEGVNVLQSVLGRIFNYGRLAIRGMGIGEVILPPIEDPIAFRMAIDRAKSV
ncbi:MAG: PH domain-containing protein [Alphaproteobacteria bacterium]|nr:PH domain-containing protein [Alphaproteobacteria bacterium]